MKNIKLHNLKYFFASTLFFLMMFFPQTHQEIKYIFLVLTLLNIPFILNSGHRIYSTKLIQWFFIYILFYVVWIGYGFININPGVFDFFRVQIIWPFLYLALLSYVNSTTSIYYIIKLLIITVFIISVYSIYALLIVMGLAPNLIGFDEFNLIGIHQGFTHVLLLSTGSLVFLLPFVMFLSTVSNNELLNKINISPYFLSLSMYTSVACGILSGRRILWVLILFSFLVSFIYNLWNQLSNRKIYNMLLKSIFTIILFVILVYAFNDKIGLDINKMVYRFTEEIDLTNKSTARNQQMKVLLNEYSKRPIFGTGFGTGVSSVVRSEKRSWTYELTYHLYLYNTGLIGIIIFVSLLLYLFYWGRHLYKMDKRNVEIIYVTLGSYASMLIASAINPFFTSSFDFQWMLFLPIGILNCLQIIGETNQKRRIEV
jgi:hypothetical protein